MVSPPSRAAEFAEALQSAAEHGQELNESELPIEIPKKRREAFALIARNELVSLAKVMPDAQSAVLLCIAWQAALQVRLTKGPLAGQCVARLSATQLVEVTGKPLRTVRWAIAKLKEHGVIEADGRAGCTSVYRVAEPGDAD